MLSSIRFMLRTFQQHWKFYIMEAVGLGFFMMSACFFSGLFWSDHSLMAHTMGSNTGKFLMMGLLMGLTALIIFYSPVTAPSGSQINPAVTLTFLRLGRISRADASFYILFQLAGGTLAVYLMKWLMGEWLTEPPVNYAVTIPFRGGPWVSAPVEIAIAFVTMSVILFSSAHHRLKNYTRLFAGILVCLWVMLAGPVSGFGMNPARSFASALPSGIWTSFWIYLLAPLAGMLGAAEVFLLTGKNASKNSRMLQLKISRSPSSLLK
jgi:aquaporin Z